MTCPTPYLTVLRETLEANADEDGVWTKTLAKKP